MDIEIISEEEIKPASPTPHHLRIYKVSILDQLIPHQYTSFLFFFPNNQSTVLNDVISERRLCLKQSLSEILVPFYPVAGKIKDSLHIECNDDGVYYVEARVKIQLSDFLMKPENELINRLFPINPSSAELLSKTFPLMVQVSMFDCGGIAIGLNASHKIFDGVSVSTFMQSWGAAARRSTEQINPSFISPSLFCPSTDLFQDPSLMLPDRPLGVDDYATRRFVFDRSALAALKTKIASTSVTAVMGLLWKSAIEASRVRCGADKKLFLSIPVNLRTRSSPPLSPHSFGNIFWMANAAQPVEDSNLDLQLLVDQIRNAIATINNDFIEGIKGEDRFLNLIGPSKDFEKLHCSDPNTKPERFLISSICKTGFYEADFGWGKPKWSCTSRGSRDLYEWGNVVQLMDTKSGEGIEAWISMKEEDMAIFEKHPELLAYASLNPSPLES